MSDKITALADRIYVCRSGSAADTQVRACGSSARGSRRARQRVVPPPPPLCALCFVALQAVSDYARRFLSEHALDKGAPASVAAAAKILRT